MTTEGLAFITFSLGMLVLMGIGLNMAQIGRAHV